MGGENGQEPNLEDQEMAGEWPDLSKPEVRAVIKARFAELQSGEHEGNTLEHIMGDLADEFKTTVGEIDSVLNSK